MKEFYWKNSSKSKHRITKWSGLKYSFYSHFTLLLTSLSSISFCLSSLRGTILILPRVPINLSKKFQRGNVVIFISKSIFSFLVAVISFGSVHAILDGSNLHRRDFGVANKESSAYLVCTVVHGHNVFCNRRTN